MKTHNSLKIVGLLFVSILIFLIFFFIIQKNKNENLPQNYSINNNNGENQTYSNNTQENPQYSPSGLPSDLSGCGENSIFSVSPIPPSNIDYIEPLGHVNPPGHVFPINHLYFYLPLDSQRTAIKTPVISPGNITTYKIERFQYYSDQSHANLIRTDYTLSFAPCKTISGFFYHLTSLSDKLISNFKSPFDYCVNVTAGDEIFQSCGKYVDVKINAGENIGEAGGYSGGSQALDWVLEDFNKPPLNYINNSRFSSLTGQDYSRYIVCPLDYFTKEISNSLYNFVGGYAIDNPFLAITKRTTAPICGTTEQDIPETVQGNWFSSDASSDIFTEGPNLALIHDDINTQLGVFSIGNTLSNSGIQSGAYYFNPKNSGQINTDFNKVNKNGGIYCYETNKKLYSNVNSAIPTQVIIIQLINPTQLKIEGLNQNNCGNGGWDFTSKAKIFYR